MKIRQVIYVMMIIMGALAEIYGLKLENNPLTVYFGAGAISYGSFAILVDYLKKKRQNKNA